jgi:hypothetical protein
MIDALQAGKRPIELGVDGESGGRDKQVEARSSCFAPGVGRDRRCNASDDSSANKSPPGGEPSVSASLAPRKRPPIAFAGSQATSWLVAW